jgi:hypothetical protein
VRQSGSLSPDRRDHAQVAYNTASSPRRLTAFGWNTDRLRSHLIGADKQGVARGMARLDPLEIRVKP